MIFLEKNEELNNFCKNSPIKIWRVIFFILLKIRIIEELEVYRAMYPPFFSIGDSMVYQQISWEPILLKWKDYTQQKQYLSRTPSRTTLHWIIRKSYKGS